MSQPGITAVIAAVGLAAALGLGLVWGRRSRPRRPVVDDARQTERSTGAAPDRLGPYRIVRELGRGATGTVYLADDPHRGTPVAIKTLGLPHGLDPVERAEARARFFREAEAAGRLRHPGIVTVLDAGEDAGLPFIAMEVVGGTDLAAHTRPGSLLPVATVVRTVARVALALDHAHRAGVVHRDVKPANVMRDPATDAIKVTDFGIASIADAERTRTGVLLGTPSYMSPEQLTGGRIDGRSDLFSLGIVLFELLTGSLPYREGKGADLLRQIADVPAPDVRERRPALPEALAHIVEVALQKRPALRHADGKAFAADLLQVLDRIDSEPPTTGR